MGRFTTPIDLEIVREPNIWRTVQPLNFDSDLYHKHIVVPADFETDLASVPRIPVAYLLAGATANAAAVVHDWLYRNPKLRQINTKEEADNIFYEAMEATGVPLWRRWLMYQAVHLFGGGAFKTLCIIVL